MEDLEEAVFAVLRELEGAEDGVDDPSQHELAGVPGAIAFEELLDGGGLVPLLTWPGAIEDLVDGMEDSPTEISELPAGTLGQADEVVHEHVHLPKGAPEGPVGALWRWC